MNQADIKDILCKESEGCNGVQKRFLYAVDNGNEISQFKCDKCYKYIRIVNGEFCSCSKYNITT